MEALVRLTVLVMFVHVQLDSREQTVKSTLVILSLVKTVASKFSVPDHQHHAVVHALADSPERTVK